MVFFEKSPSAPESLAKHESYREKDTILLLRTDFKNKCYLCEAKAPTTINVEHFRPHKGNVDLMFDWNNLFLVCGHCNNTKSALENAGQLEPNGILDCTNLNDRVDKCISYRLITFTESTTVQLKNEQKMGIVDFRIENTIKLLHAIYNGYKNSPLKEIESENLLNSLLSHVAAFNNLIIRYKSVGGPQKTMAEKDIMDLLSNDSPFTAFSRWIVRDDPMLTPIFAAYL